MRVVWPWLLVTALGLAFGLGLAKYVADGKGAEPLVWHSPHALVLLGGALLVAAIAFHLRRRRAAALGFSQVALVGARGAATWLSDLPAVLRALALAQLRRSDAKSKVVILLSDGDNNWVTRFSPDDAARAARDMGVKVYTLLVGREEADLFGGMSVNPATLRNIAQVTGGEFFRADDYESFAKGFATVRSRLDTTKRTVTERVPDHQLFVGFAALAAALVALELLLAHTRLRRLP